MASKDRSKNVWFVPKRANVHQMVALLDGIITRSYDGSTWNTSKQDNLNLDLKNWGATRSGNKIAPQGMRTLLASVHYLGFVYLDSSSKSTILRVTETGYNFYNYHKSSLIRMPRLERELSINTSDYVKEQLIKLQITNPILLPHCEDIFVFPFRVILKMLIELGYLDKEEIAMYAFHTKNLSEIDYKIQEIKTFRQLDASQRKMLVDAYSKTEIGNLTLVQAASAGYFMQFCVSSGMIQRTNRKVGNRDRSIDCIEIVSSEVVEANRIIDYFKDTNTYNFESNLELWINYFGNPRRLKPPINISVVNETHYDLYIEYYNQNHLSEIAILAQNEKVEFATFKEEEYSILIYDIASTNQLYEMKKSFTCSEKIKITNNLIQGILNDNLSYQSLNQQELMSEIIEHLDSKTFSEKMLIKLRMLNLKLKIDKEKDKALRGAQFEYLVYLYLFQLKEQNKIDDVIWNGKIGKYNLPLQSPGGKYGTPDMVIIIENIHYVLELTTIKSKDAQFKAELSSVPDHIRLYAEKLKGTQKVHGIFCAPEIHERNHNTMKAILQSENVPFISITSSDFFNIFEGNTKEEILNKLSSYYS